MDNLYFGEILRIRREELNMSQEELCDGILDRTALSRIEIGKAECRKYIAELLLERLGLPMEFYYASSTKSEIAQLKIKNQINDAIRMREYERLPELIESGKKIQDSDPPFNQFIIETEGIYALRAENDIPKARELLLSAMRVFHNDFELGDIEKLRLIKEEIIILNAIANTYCEAEDYITAINIYKTLLKSTEQYTMRTDDEEIIHIIIMLKYNLSRALGRTDQYKDCLEIADEAIELCQRYVRLTYLAELFMNKGYALCSIHGRKEEGILALKDALVLNRLVGFEDNIEIIYRDAKNLFNIDLRQDF